MTNRKAVSAVIVSGEYFLVLKRNPIRYTGWGLVKGGIEFQELPVNALMREVQEEIGLEINVSQVQPLDFTTGYYDAKKECSVDVVWFYVTITAEQKNAIILEEAEWLVYEWVEAQEAMQRLTWQTEKEALIYVLSLNK